MLDSDLEGSGGADDMPETEDDGGELNLDISDERKRLQAVLAHFDGGEATASQGKAQQAAVVRPRLSGILLEASAPLVCAASQLRCLATQTEKLFQAQAAVLRMCLWLTQGLCLT